MTYDAIIIGAGPAGSAAALMLARAGWSVAIVEKTEFPRHKVCGEFLSATNQQLLRELGVEEEFAASAGPEVRRAGLFVKHHLLSAPMPRGSSGFGRALGRERLDTLLLATAARAGATVLQPWRVNMVTQHRGRHVCSIAGAGGHRELEAAVVIAAHGSWERGPLPMVNARQHRASDLFAFKAHFRNCDLPGDLMPLLAFPGGYGGMVHSDHDRVTLSCCIRRDTLRACRHRESERHAADAVLAYIRAHCLGARQALRRAVPDDGTWLAAGPIRPGRRAVYADGIFRIGNLAGEAHPVVAEGISMALQSAWLLGRRLIAAGPQAAAAPIARGYRRDWDASFALRLRAAALVAKLAMRPWLIGLAVPALRLVPGVITLGAYLSGKSRRVVLPAALPDQARQ